MVFGAVGRCCGNYYGPKYLVCIMVTSVWGFLFLIMLGIFFQIKSAILIEDVRAPPIENITTHAQAQAWISGVEAELQNQAINCFVAAVLYMVTFLAAGFRFRLLMKKSN